MLLISLFLFLCAALAGVTAYMTGSTTAETIAVLCVLGGAGAMFVAAFDREDGK